MFQKIETMSARAPNLSITDNLIMKDYRRAPLANGWSLNYGLAKKSATRLKG